MFKIMNLPARTEGKHSRLGTMIRDEAKRHMKISEEMAAELPKDDPNVKEFDEKDRDMRISNIENFIWRWVTMGWVRLTDDWELVFWNPIKEDFEEFSASLSMIYKDMLENLSPICDNEPYTGEKKPLQEVGNDVHTGKVRKYT